MQRERGREKETEIESEFAFVCVRVCMFAGLHCSCMKCVQVMHACVQVCFLCVCVVRAYIFAVHNGYMSVCLYVFFVCITCILVES